MKYTIDEIIDLSPRALDEFVESGDICGASGCYNKPSNGLTLCVHCAYEVPVAASQELRLAKRLLEKDRLKSLYKQLN